MEEFCLNLERLIEEEKNSRKQFGVRLPQQTIRHFKMGCYFYGKTEQKVVEELFEQFYDSIIAQKNLSRRE